MFPARLAEIREARKFIDTFCRDTGIAHASSLRLNLVIEELFTNTVTHGHGGDCDLTGWIKLEARKSTVSLTYLDQAPAFNPLGIAPQPIHESAIEHRKVGGLGVLLATELTAASEYAHMYGRNRLRMVLVR